MTLPPMPKEDEEIVKAPPSFTTRFEEMLKFVNEINVPESGRISHNKMIMIVHESRYQQRRY